MPRVLRAPSRLLPLCLALLFAAQAPVLGCSKSDAAEEKRPLSPFRFASSAENLHLTWIDEHGDTHETTTVEQVPRDFASMVRVVIDGSKDGASDPIYVADLSTQSANYTAHSLPRARWDAEITRRRESGGEEIVETRPQPRRPPADPQRLPPALRRGPAAPQELGTLDPTYSKVVAIVYGASWCGACHQAEAHLKRRGVKTILKDIEADRSAGEEMALKLQKAGGHRGSIPVIDINGQILVGFSTQQLDRALDKARGS